MTYRLLQLPPDTYDFVQSRIESGRYENPNQLVQAAFRALSREEGATRSESATATIAEEDAFRKLWEAAPLMPEDRRKVKRPD